jgi:hypothetical protein
MGQWIIRTWIAAILFLIAVGIHTQAPLAASHCPPYEGDNTSKTNQEYCAPLGVLVLLSLRDLRVAVGAFLRGHKEETDALSTIAIAVFTGTLWWVTLGMVRITKEQRIDMLRSVKATEDSAMAAQKTVDLLMAVEIPRLIVTGFKMEASDTNLHYALNGFSVTVTVYNAGKREAIVTSYIFIHRVTSGITTLLWPKYKATEASRIISPGMYEDFSFGDHESIAGDEIADILSGNKTLHIFGFVYYKDFFSNSHDLTWKAHLKIVRTGEWGERGPDHDIGYFCEESDSEDGKSEPAQ